MAMEFEMHDHMDTMHTMHDMHHGNHDHASMMAMGDDSQGGEHLLCSSDGMAGGMVMYMEGFQWTLQGEGSCLNLFVASWKLDTYWKFFAAMVCVVGMGIATEGINRWKHTAAQAANAYARTTNSTNNSNHHHHQYAAMQHTCLQGLSILSAYLLMLVVMTYSLELLSCVIVGLMIGHYVFDGDSLHRGTGGTPCCTFLETRTTGTTGERSDDNGNGTTEAVGSSLTDPLLSRTTPSDNNGSTTLATTSKGTLVVNSCCSNEDGAGTSQHEEEGII